MEAETQILEYQSDVHALLAQIKWDDSVPIIWCQSQKYSLWDGFKITIAYNGLDKKTVLHALAHECFHVLIENKYKAEEYLKWFVRLSYLREYKVEKRVREFCRDRCRNDILDSSDRWVDRFKNISKPNKQVLPYTYAARRIVREESIGRLSRKSYRYR